jgi:tetratricopeptide (TPR) repeat protein
MLDEAERSFFETMAVFAGGWTLEAAAAVAGLDENRSLDLNEELARHSLVHIHNMPLGPRARMLETVREFVSERLAARADEADIRRRHAEFYRAFAEESERQLRTVGHDELHERLYAEIGNLAAAVEWYLANDRTPLPHLFRVLFPIWEMRDQARDAHGWVQRMVSAFDELDLDPQARAELVWARIATANELGDDSAVLSGRECFEELLDGIRDPGLHAVSLVVMAWTSPILGDFDRSLREASSAVDELRALDDPYWLCVALASTGFALVNVGRHDEALARFRESREMADQLDNAWLSAISRLWIGTLALWSDRPAEARLLLEEALDLGLSAHSTTVFALCLVGFARFYLKTGDAEKAARLAGAAEGLRRRVGLKVWPPLRRGEAELGEELRLALGRERFDTLCAEGARLNQREALELIGRDPIDASATSRATSSRFSGRRPG